MIPTALLTDPNVKWTATRVYGVLASHMNPKTRQAWCGLGRMARALEIQKPNVSKALRQLQDGGYIVKMRKGGGRGRNTLYLITPPEKCMRGDTLSEYENDLAGEEPTENTEAKNFAGSVIPGDNERVSQETPKDIPEDNLPPLPPLAGGEKAAPDGATCRGLNAPDGRGPSAGFARSARADLVEEFSPLPKPEPPSAGYAREQIAKRLGGDNRAYALLMAADDPDAPLHRQAREAVEGIAEELGIYWKPPTARAAQ